MYAELSDKSRSKNGVNPATGFHPLDDLHYHGPVRNGAERASHLAGATVNAFFIINHCLAGFVGGYGAQVAGAFAGPRYFNDRPILAGALAETAFNTFCFIDERTVGNYGNCFFGTTGDTAVGQTIAAGVGNDKSVKRTFIAGDRQDLNHRRLGENSAQSGGSGFRNGYGHGLAQGGFDPVLQYGAFLMNAAAVTRTFFRDDRKQDCFHIFLQSTLKSHLRYFSKHFAADFYYFIYFRHGVSLPPIIGCFAELPAEVPESQGSKIFR